MYLSFTDVIAICRFLRYEKLQRWDDALKAYTSKASQASSPHLGLDATLGLYYWISYCII